MKSYVAVFWDYPLTSDNFLKTNLLEFCNSNERLKIFFKHELEFVFLKENDLHSKHFKKNSFKAFFILAETKCQGVNRIKFTGLNTLRDLRKHYVSVPIFLFSFLKKKMISSTYQYEIDEKYQNFHVQLPEFKSLISSDCELSELSEMEINYFINSVIKPKGKAGLILDELFTKVQEHVSTNREREDSLFLVKKSLNQISDLLPEIKKPHIKDVIFQDMKNEIDNGAHPINVIEAYRDLILHKIERYIN